MPFLRSSSFLSEQFELVVADEIKSRCSNKQMDTIISDAVNIAKEHETVGKAHVD